MSLKRGRDAATASTAMSEPKRTKSQMFGPMNFIQRLQQFDSKKPSSILICPNVQCDRHQKRFTLGEEKQANQRCTSASCDGRLNHRTLEVVNHLEKVRDRVPLLDKAEYRAQMEEYLVPRMDKLLKIERDPKYKNLFDWMVRNDCMERGRNMVRLAMRRPTLFWNFRYHEDSIRIRPERVITAEHTRNPQEEEEEEEEEDENGHHEANVQDVEEGIMKDEEETESDDNMSVVVGENILYDNHNNGFNQEEEPLLYDNDSQADAASDEDEEEEEESKNIDKRKEVEAMKRRMTKRRNLPDWSFATIKRKGKRKTYRTNNINGSQQEREEEEPQTNNVPISALENLLGQLNHDGSGEEGPQQGEREDESDMNNMDIVIGQVGQVHEQQQQQQAQDVELVDQAEAIENIRRILADPFAQSHASFEEVRRQAQANVDRRLATLRETINDKVTEIMNEELNGTMRQRLEEVGRQAIQDNVTRLNAAFNQFRALLAQTIREYDKK